MITRSKTKAQKATKKWHILLFLVFFLHTQKINILKIFKDIQKQFHLFEAICRKCSSKIYNSQICVAKLQRGVCMAEDFANKSFKLNCNKFVKIKNRNIFCITSKDSPKIPPDGNAINYPNLRKES